MTEPNVMKRSRGKLVVVNNENPPLNLQPGEQVWTTFNGEWQLVTVVSIAFGRSQTNVQYALDEIGGLLDAAWFWHEKPQGSEFL